MKIGDRGMFEYKKGLLCGRLLESLFISTSLATMTLSSPALAEYPKVQTLSEYQKDQALSKFNESKYYPCDVKLIADYWSSNKTSTMYRVGILLIEGLNWHVDKALENARDEGLSCAWADTGFEYADAERVAKIWKFSGGVEEAQIKMAAAATRGDSQKIKERILDSPGPYDPDFFW
jgi:hypothetical protein